MGPVPHTRIVDLGSNKVGFGNQPLSLVARGRWASRHISTFGLWGAAGQPGGIRANQTHRRVAQGGKLQTRTYFGRYDTISATGGWLRKQVLPITCARRVAREAQGCVAWGMSSRWREDGCINHT